MLIVVVVDEIALWLAAERLVVVMRAPVAVGMTPKTQIRKNYAPVVVVVVVVVSVVAVAAVAAVVVVI